MNQSSSGLLCTLLVSFGSLLYPSSLVPVTTSRLVLYIELLLLAFSSSFSVTWEYFFPFPFSPSHCFPSNWLTQHTFTYGGRIVWLASRSPLPLAFFLFVSLWVSVSRVDLFQSALCLSSSWFFLFYYFLLLFLLLLSLYICFSLSLTLSLSPPPLFLSLSLSAQLNSCSYSSDSVSISNIMSYVVKCPKWSNRPVLVLSVKKAQSTPSVTLHPSFFILVSSQLTEHRTNGNEWNVLVSSSSSSVILLLTALTSLFILLALQSPNARSA